MILYVTSKVRVVEINNCTLVKRNGSGGKRRSEDMTSSGREVLTKGKVFFTRFISEDQ
jgi:hypothetical protein